MKRTSILRRTRLRRTTPVRPRNAKRAKAARERNFGPQSKLARTLPCCSCGAPPPSDPSHLKARGMGGANSDDTFVIPQCRGCHIRMGNEGVASFWRRIGKDPWALLKQMRARVAGDNSDAPVSPVLGETGWL